MATETKSITDTWTNITDVSSSGVIHHVIGEQVYLTVSAGVPVAEAPSMLVMDNESADKRNVFQYSGIQAGESIWARTSNGKKATMTVTASDASASVNVVFPLGISSNVDLQHEGDLAPALNRVITVSESSSYVSGTMTIHIDNGTDNILMDLVLLKDSLIEGSITPTFYGDSLIQGQDFDVEHYIEGGIWKFKLTNLDAVKILTYNMVLKTVIT